jgi:hypothetical protein
VERKHLPLASLEALVLLEVDERVCLGDYRAPLTRGAIDFWLRTTIAQAGFDQLPCIGGEAGRLLSCAAHSQSYAGIAICAVGPKMNQEWMIAAQCAASSGGVPVTAAACTAGWLTLNELSKCFSQGIGGGEQYHSQNV